MKTSTMTRAWFRAVLVAAVVAALPSVRAQERPPLRLAIAGLVHGHVSGFLRAAQARTDVQIVGVFDPDAALLRSYAERYKIPDTALFTDLAAMLDAHEAGGRRVVHQHRATIPRSSRRRPRATSTS